MFLLSIHTRLLKLYGVAAIYMRMNIEHDRVRFSNEYLAVSSLNSIRTYIEYTDEHNAIAVVAANDNDDADNNNTRHRTGSH